ncbi:MAG TPA: hypothetical protein VI461_13760, partial [Chitinophagaceae bacterium]|nr:hypothetical protein [Chitinophagaceae bacterium]
MKNKYFIQLTLLLLIFCNHILSQTDNNKYDPSLDEAQKWFKAWDLVYKDVYVLKEIKPVDFVLFDETYVYTTSKITGKDGINIIGPNLSGKSLIWTKKAHNGKIRLP